MRSLHENFGLESPLHCAADQKYDVGVELPGEADVLRGLIHLTVTIDHQARPDPVRKTLARVVGETE